MHKLVQIISLILLIPTTAWTQDSISIKKASKPISLTLQVSNPVADDIYIGWFNIDTESIDNYKLKTSSYSVGLVGQFHIDKTTTLRLRTAITVTNIKEHNDNPRESGPDQVVTSESNIGEQIKIHVAPGVL